jgi:opacity protein-like surface antigen
MKRTLVVFGGLAVWPLAALAQAPAEPAEVPAQEIAALGETSDLLASGGGLASGQAAQPSPSADLLTRTGRPARWGFNVSIGALTASGDFSSLLRTPVSGEMNVFRTRGPWRFGGGVSFGSFKMKDPYHNSLEWGFLQPYLSATRMLRTEGSFRPYLQVRGGLARLHPRSHLFDESPLSPDYVLGDSTTRAANGFSVAVVPGLEWNLNRKVALDLSAAFSYFDVGDYDLSPVGLPPASSASTFEARLGVRWHPDNGYPSGPRESVPEDSKRDAWGVAENYGWAAAEVIGINLFSAGFNEYMRNGNFNQTSPRSWWRNIKDGFSYDDNDFRTNQFLHSYNGNVYFNSARANGLGFWTSSAYAAFGAFFWECCGETHPMSYNDMIATTVGGITMGEVTYRLSSEILDNQATGGKRFFKELSSFVIDPVRGLNRLISGRSTTKYKNPTDDMDWRPPHGSTLFGLGVRVVGQETFGKDTNTYANLLLDHAYGNPWDNERRKPFDYMEMTLQLTPGEKQPLTILRIRGDLWQKPLGDAESPNHVFAISQYYDYMNNSTWEFGGQSLAATLHSRFRLSKNVGLTTRASVLFLSLAAVNSDYADIAQVADRERLREYDYGPGTGFHALANVLVKGRPMVTAHYRFNWINVANGSIYSQGQSGLGSNANHYVQYGFLRGFVPLFGKWGLGADAFVFLRKSRYSAPGFQDIDQKNTRLRIFLARNTAR